MTHEHGKAHAPSIPSPDTSVDGLYKTCMALKQAVEEMRGELEGDFRPRMTISDQPPAINQDGEFWLSEGSTNVLSVSYQGKWRKVAPITP